MLARKFTRVPEKDVRETEPLLVRVHSYLMNEGRRTVGDLRPEQTVFQLEPEHADGTFIVEGYVIQAGMHMPFHCRFTHFSGAPERLAFSHQACRG